MSLHELAGKPAPRELLVNVPRLVSAYFSVRPDPEKKDQCVSFGTSGHRGSALDASFNDAHIAAICQALAEVRKADGVDGPMLVGIDTHALSEAAFTTALEVLAANGVELRIQQGGGFTPTPVISHAILTYNEGRSSGLADGIVITPSHNPPQDGGFKYNPPTGGPAPGETTGRIENRANELLFGGLNGVQRMSIYRARASGTTQEVDFLQPYVEDLAGVIDMDAIAGSGLKIGADPMGGAGVAYWEPIADRYGLDIEVVNPRVDPTFSFMTVDKDGKIRMDCSSPYAMAGLIKLKDGFDIAFGNDPDFDRHGIVTRSGGLMNPNHYLSV
ncbi:MAG: phosphoglucomutase, partial [Rhodothermales bacterium]